MHRLLIAALISTALGACCGEAQQPATPKSAVEDPIANFPATAGRLLNGKYDDYELAGGNTRVGSPGPGVVAHFSHDQRYFYIAVWTDTVHTGVDLYLEDAGACYRLLHVSSALGEAMKCDSGWSDLEFGLHDDWAANTVPYYFEDDQPRTEAPRIFEFQIRLWDVALNPLRMMVHFKRPERIAPEGADPDDPETWFTLGPPVEGRETGSP